MSTPVKFRGDIQGLRALAVLAVLLFHIDVSLFKGGFLGVDIFFVISGYLITGNIIKQHDAGSFTFKAFYIRRFKRLIPAATVTIALTLIMGYFFLAPSDWQESGRVGFHALLLSSNFVFWADAGYFDAAAITKPLLHFWSLSLEEQFYFIWPIILIFCLSKLGKKGLFISVILLSALSLIFAELFITEHPDAVFFLMPFRIFEFGAGALLAVKKWQIPDNKFKSIAVALGLALMIGAICLMDKTSRMPGLLSLIPVIGCALIIASPQAKLSFILSNKVARLIGDASYSIYLVHWPMVVFYKMSVDLHLSLPVQIAIFIASIVLGCLQYYLIETPFRYNKFWQSKRMFGLPQVLAISAIFITLYGAASLWNHSSQTSFTANNANIETMTRRHPLRRATLDMRKANLPGEGTAKAKVHIIGDSQAKGMAITMTQLGFNVVSHHWVPAYCQANEGDPPVSVMFTGKGFEEDNQNTITTHENLWFYENDMVASTDIILMAARWEEPCVDLLGPSLELLKEHTNAHIMIVGMGAEFDTRVPPFFEKLDIKENANTEIISQTRPEWEHNAAFKEIAKLHGATYLDRRRLQCIKGPCPIYLPDTRELLYYDSHHITVAGSKYMARNIKACRETSCKILNKTVRRDK